MSDYELKNKIILSFDVEDNFTRDELARPDDWDKYESQVVENTKRVIQLLKILNANATFFVVGKVAERHPEIVQMIDDAGFEVGSHGYAHEPVDQMTPAEFEEDLEKSILIIENLISKKVQGYRARSFSITRDTLWAFDIMKSIGLKYDSSLTQTELDFLTDQKSDFSKVLKGFVEIPVSNKRFMGRNWSISGGIVLRLSFFPLYNFLLNYCCKEQSCRIIYAHVWEFNKDQPSRKVGLLQKIAQSSLTYTTESKIKKVAAKNEFISLESYLKSHRGLCL